MEPKVGYIIIWDHARNNKHSFSMLFKSSQTTPGRFPRRKISTSLSLLCLLSPGLSRLNLLLPSFLISESKKNSSNLVSKKVKISNNFFSPQFHPNQIKFKFRSKIWKIWGAFISKYFCSDAVKCICRQICMNLLRTSGMQLDM